MSSDLAERIFKDIDNVVEKSLSKILNDISERYDIDITDIEYIDIKKKKINGYNKYNKKRRKEMLEENPKMDFGQMSKIIGKEWTQLSEKEKEGYK